MVLQKTDNNIIYDAGLSSDEADKRLKKHGPNIIKAKKKISWLKILAYQFKDVLVLILLTACIVSFFLGEKAEAAAIILIVAANGILGFVQEYKTERTLESLKKMAAPSARVLRNKKFVTIPASNLVPGDIVEVTAGDKIPADGQIFNLNHFSADESMLTGESVSCLKSLNEEKEKSRVYMGTLVVSGWCSFKVTATGMNTQMGKIAGLIEGAGEKLTPLQIRLEKLGKFIGAGCILICALVSVAGILKGENALNMLLTGISLAVAAIPEGLLAIVTISLALGVQRMLRKNALVRKLPAVETLGCSNVICSDKTGTLTQNRMTVKEVYTADKTYKVIKNTLISGTLCSSLKMDENGLIGDPMEKAIAVYADEKGILYDDLIKKHKKVHEIPFDSKRKRMTVIYDAKNALKAFVKGAPEVILDRCEYILSEKGIGKLDVQRKNKIIKENKRMANKAYRVIAVAFKELEGGFNPDNDGIETGLVFSGLIGMMDPPREKVKDSVKKCINAGIRPVMITGDQRETAIAIAKEIGLTENKAKVLTGKEIDRMNDMKLKEAVKHTAVFARVNPSHKIRIVKAFKENGNVTAMTGDGVNDAPALKEADIGISMGKSGTEVAREASAMVLLDDDFSTIVSAVEEGRTIYSNIRKFIRYMLSCNIGEVLTMFIGMLAGFPALLLPIQILWVNLVTDGLPAIALGLEKADEDIMERKPEGREAKLFDKKMVRRIIFRGILIGISTFLIFFIVIHLTGNKNMAGTCAFATLVMAQLFHVFECKSETKGIFKIRIFSNIYLVLAVICSVIMLTAVIYIPSLQIIFKTCPLGLREWEIIIGTAALGPVFGSLFRTKHE